MNDLAFAYGSIVGTDGKASLAVRDLERHVDLRRWAQNNPGLDPIHRAALLAPDLSSLLAANRDTWEAVDQISADLLSTRAAETLDAGIELRMPFVVEDYVDFFTSRHHALNTSKLFRPENPTVPKAFDHLPIAYHGRAGTVVPSGTPIHRPRGQIKVADSIEFTSTRKMDLEAEIGFVLGGSATNGPVAATAIRERIFGVCIVNDWSARDIQQFEYVPLGPFLGKSFATTVSAWVTPLSRLEDARVRTPADDTENLASYLRGAEGWGLAITLEVEVDGDVISRPDYTTSHWSAAHMLAHLTVNGSSLRPGDLIASGTVSGPDPQQVGSLLELYKDSKYLQDSATVVVRAHARLPDEERLQLFEAQGRVHPAAALNS